MHEMPVTQSLLNMILEEAKDCRVTDIYIDVGEVSFIVPDQVEIFFKYLSRGTIAENARLHFQTKPLEIKCPDCKRPCDLSAFRDEEPRAVLYKALSRECECGNQKMGITNGTGFELVSIEVEKSY
jgi:hydrogenase nickel incorporation protein HypA/HybF